MKPNKVKVAKQFTRMQAERLLSSRAMPPEAFFNINAPLTVRDPKNPGGTTNHPNPHVLRKAWRIMGCPLPDLSAEDMSKFNRLMRVKPDKTEKVEKLEETTAPVEPSK